jgi:hypothetical protein
MRLQEFFPDCLRDIDFAVEAREDFNRPTWMSEVIAGVSLTTIIWAIVGAVA